MHSMLKPIILEQTSTTPEIILDKENNVFQISGRSIIENAHEFYQPVREWFKQYIKDPNQSTELFLNYEYLNSSSSLQLMKIIFLLEELLKKNIEVKIIWFYESNDELSKERGEEIQVSTDMSFKIEEFIDETEIEYEDFSFDF